MKNDSNQENIIDLGETVLSSVTMDSQSNQTTSAPPDSSNYQNNHDNVRLIRVSKPIQTVKYCSNSISTSKYNFLTFLPIFLFEQFQKYSNVFFLIIVILQQIPGVSPTGRYTTLVPLVFILGVSAIKEILEDYKRRKSDKMLNNKKTRVFRPSNYIESSWSSVKWKDICVGDIVKITAGELFPADLLILSSSEPNSICYIQTSNLDGETNLKIRQGLSKTCLLIDSDHLKSFNAEIECELPNQHLYEFSGNLKFLDETLELPIGPDQILLRGSLLQNTKWIYGIVIYTGHETKIMKNSTSPPFKRSQVEKSTNPQIVALFIILFVISLFSAITSEIWLAHNSKSHWYLGFGDESANNFFYSFLTFFILYNNLIPISLQVTLELVKFLQASFINMDEEMYDAENGFSAIARTSNLNEELGQVKYVFSDKTGTLTCNKMEFKRCSIAGIQYGTGNEQEFNCYELLNNLSTHETKKEIDEFLTLLATCHTVIPDKREDSPEIFDYQASSPDESAFVKALQRFGIVFHSRTPDKIKVKFLEEEREYQILNLLEFNSNRKRMSVILKDQDGTIKLYCKGADNVIIPRVSLYPEDFRSHTDVTVDHLESFAKEGFRTLVLAYRTISKEEYEKWNADYLKAALSINGREKKIEECAESIEKNLIVLGVTAIEDKLQEEVPETIRMLLRAGIKMWVLTGDKIETAVNIGYSSKLIDEDTQLIYLIDERLEKLKETIKINVYQINNRFKNSQVALVIDGKALNYILSFECKKEFLELAIACKTVICCRATPRNKAQIVDLIKKHTHSITLAIGDGANDVSMIQAAHVGVGIYGKEGTQALSASDYAIGKFRFLAKLLFVHGIWNYKRLCKVILYSFYKNICLYIIEFWFALSNGFSGQILFERWLISLYNVLFTAAPPMALGLFDRPSMASTMIKFPELYKICQDKADFNIRVFWTWIMNAFIHSIVLYFVCYGIFKKDMVLNDGTIGDYLFMGNHVYTYCVIVVCLKSGLETDSWTWITHLSIWGSIGFWFIFSAIYSQIWTWTGLAPEMSGMAPNVYRCSIFWMGLIFVPILVLLPDFIYKSLQRTLFKTYEQAIQENEANNKEVERLIRRSRFSETARLLKSAFSFTRVPSNLDQNQRYRGFAFSQEENGVVRQADLIRVYNTNVDKPSGR